MWCSGRVVNFRKCNISGNFAELSGNVSKKLDAMTYNFHSNSLIFPGAMQKRSHFFLNIMHK